MAKTSMIERNNKRPRLAKKFKTRRTRLRAIAADRSLPAEERFAARLKLGELPRNSPPTPRRPRCDVPRRRPLARAPQARRAAAQLLAAPHPQPMRSHRPAPRLLPQAPYVAHRAA